MSFLLFEIVFLFLLRAFSLLILPVTLLLTLIVKIVEQALIAEREHQAEMKKAFGRGYCKKYEDYICVDAVGELIRPNYVSDHYAIVLRMNGLRKIRFHDLRHSCASLLLANGVQMKLIQEWLGHSDIGTTSNVYSHVDSESKKLSAEAIAKALE